MTIKGILKKLEWFWWLVVAGLLVLLTGGMALWLKRRGDRKVIPPDPGFLDMAVEASQEAKSEALVEKAKAKATADVQIARIEKAAREPDVSKRLDALAGVMNDL